MDNFLAILNEVWVNGLLGVSMTKIIASIAVLLLSFLLRGFVVTVVVCPPLKDLQIAQSLHWMMKF